jgi:DNA (cytosine-5)-methyltransferase 1
VVRPLLLDLFCCEGGAAVGYHRAGFDVIGVDIEPQPRYPFHFIRADVMTLDMDWITTHANAIHASPPCQSYTTMSNRHGSKELELIEPVRELLRATGLPYIIENVVGARRHMKDPLMLHGGHFGINVYRPRLFESNVLLMAPTPAKPPKNAAAVYGRERDAGYLIWERVDGSRLVRASLDEAREAMGMPWASWNGCREAIPPAYTEFIGAQLLEHVKAAAA